MANFAQQIKAAASSAVQKMHSISAHASLWWKKRRRSSAENANRSAEATGNEGYQHEQEAASASAAAARTEQPGASSTTGSAAAERCRKRESTHGQCFAVASRRAHSTFTFRCPCKFLLSCELRRGGRRSVKRDWQTCSVTRCEALFCLRRQSIVRACFLFFCRC